MNTYFYKNELCIRAILASPEIVILKKREYYDKFSIEHNFEHHSEISLCIRTLKNDQCRPIFSLKFMEYTNVNAVKALFDVLIEIK